MQPLINYYGGKARIATQILPCIEAIPHTVYVEPFCGGAAVLFAKPRRIVTNDAYYRECINDLSGLLVNLYKVAREQPEELQRWIELTLYSQADYAEAMSVCKNPEGHTDLKKAWAYYVNIQMSFARKLNGGWGTSIASQNQAATWDNKKLSLPEKLDRLKAVHVSCEDALKCIQRWDSPQTLFYCDPPYPETSMGHYAGYTMNDFQRLCGALDSCEGSYVLSNYFQPVEPQSAQRKVEIEAIMSAAKDIKGQARTEALWICDRSGTVTHPDTRKILKLDETRTQLQLDL